MWSINETVSLHKTIEYSWLYAKLEFNISAIQLLYVHVAIATYVLVYVTYYIRTQLYVHIYQDTYTYWLQVVASYVDQIIKIIWITFLYNYMDLDLLVKQKSTVDD